MPDSRSLPPESGNSVATLLAYLVHQAGGMVVLPHQDEICSAVRGSQLHTEIDTERGKVIVTLVKGLSAEEGL